MKKNTVNLLIILAVIVLMHLVFVIIFISSGPARPEVITPPPEPTVIFPEKISETPRSPAPVQKKTPDRANTSTVNFDYSDTVHSVPGINEIKKIRSGILVDPQTGKVLWAKNATSPVPIASMSKMMTLLLALEKLKANILISLDTDVEVSVSSTKVQPTIAGLKSGSSIKLHMLLQTMIIRSANDAAELTAEFFGNGSAEKFIDDMNQRALQLGMKHTRFSNAHGLPAPNSANDNTGSCENMVILAMTLLKHPEAAEWVKMTGVDFVQSGHPPVHLASRNRLLKSCPGVEGIKTGYTRNAGSCVTTLCKRNGKELIAVIAGAKSYRYRDAAAAKLFDWGFSQLDGK
ncbi:MAG: D-alanyl-D-alanine carboxypeptidase [Victivallales bacterium]|nr:D-alanyl-D-alanine carboxypeptidase [Victivallales bacterium]